MKKIVFITYSFGFSSPVGAGGERIVKALAKLGTYVYVITSHCHNEIIPNVRIIAKQNSPRIPSRFSVMISNFIGREMGYIIWEWKAFRAAKKILKRDSGIVAIYTRACPISVCPIGIKLKKRFHLPLLMHFTDPIPAPIEWVPNKTSRARMIRQMRKYLPSADLLSFGNGYMLRYEEKTLGFSIQEKSFISPDPSANCFVYLPERKRDDKNIRMLFLGNIYGNRKPTYLFEAINNLSNKYNISLLLYGKNTNTFPSFVINHDRTNDILDAMMSSDIMVDIDGDDEDPVFVSSKLRDYLTVNRPILAITPNDSPSRELLKGLKTVEVSRNNTAEIQEAILKLIKSDFSRLDYEERELIANSFNADTIARDIIKHINSIVK